jgi:prepilin-type N-terminal cleavage/methylation domain-containing protein
VTSRQGFTLVELLVVIALIAMLASLGLIFSFQFVRAQHLREDAQLVAAETMLASAEALAQKDDASHGVKTFADRVVRFTGPSYAGRTASKDVTTAFPLVATLGGDDEVVFPAGGLVPDAPSSVTLTIDGRTLTITVSAYGLVEIR